MSVWGKLFGGKKAEDAPTPQEAIQRLRETEELLQKRSEFLEKKIQGEIGNAKKHGTKNKRLALQALKRKKTLEKQLQQIDGTLSTIEFQREALENASTNTEVLSVMSGAAKSLKQAHNNMDIDKVHDLMDDIAEQQDVAKEISDAISNPVGFGANDLDEDDLMKELEELEQEELDSKLLDVGPSADNLPAVPADSLPAAAARPAQKKVEDDDLAELAEWAS